MIWLRNKKIIFSLHTFYLSPEGCWVVFLIFVQIYKNILQANSGDPDQTRHSVASGQGLHYWPMSHNKDTKAYMG